MMLSLKIKKETGEEFDYVFSKDENSSYFLNIKSLSEGKYFYTLNYNSSELIKNGEFTIIPRVKERINTAKTTNFYINYQIRVGEKCLITLMLKQYIKVC